MELCLAGGEPLSEGSKMKTVFGKLSWPCRRPLRLSFPVLRDGGGAEARSLLVTGEG